MNYISVTKNGKTMTSSYSDGIYKELEMMGINLDKELVVSLIKEINTEIDREKKNG